MAYATPDDLTAWVSPVPDDAEDQLDQASAMLDADVLFAAVYDVDADGLPTDALVADAFRRAVCAQVQWWDQVGDSTGAEGAGVTAVAIGGLSISRAASAPSGQDSAARQIAPKAWTILRSPKLAGRLRLGVVTTGGC